MATIHDMDKLQKQMAGFSRSIEMIADSMRLSYRPDEVMQRLARTAHEAALALERNRPTLEMQMTIFSQSYSMAVDSLASMNLSHMSQTLKMLQDVIDRLGPYLNFGQSEELDESATVMPADVPGTTDELSKPIPKALSEAQKKKISLLELANLIVAVLGILINMWEAQPDKNIQKIADYMSMFVQMSEHRIRLGEDILEEEKRQSESHARIADALEESNELKKQELSASEKAFLSEYPVVVIRIEKDLASLPEDPPDLVSSESET